MRMLGLFAISAMAGSAEAPIVDEKPDPKPQPPQETAEQRVARLRRLRSRGGKVCPKNPDHGHQIGKYCSVCKARMSK